MKCRFLITLFCLSAYIILCCSSIAFAAELDPGSDPGSEEPSESSGAEVTTITDDSGVTVNVTLAVPQSDSSSESEDPSADPLAIAETAVTGDSTSNADDTAPAEGFPSMVTALFGEYTPRTYSVTTYLSDGSTVTTTEYVPGLAGLDWPWIAGVVLFSLVLYSFFRLLGGVLRG